MCPFAVQCWGWLNIQVDPNLDVLQLFQSFKAQLATPFFMEIIVLMCWCIWKARNDHIFRHIPLVSNTNADFRKEFELLLLRGKQSYFPLIRKWISQVCFSSLEFVLHFFLCFLISLLLYTVCLCNCLADLQSLLFF